MHSKRIYDAAYWHAAGEEPPSERLPLVAVVAGLLGAGIACGTFGYAAIQAIGWLLDTVMG